MSPLSRRAVLACLAAASLSAAPAAQAAGDVTIFAAASMKNALEEVAAGYEAETGTRVRLSLAGSSALARQIEAGAPADVFISANTGWMDRIEDAGLVVEGSRFDLARNALALVGPAGAAPVALDAGTDVAALLGEGRLAMALVDAVPAGIYGKAALISLGQWDAVAPKVAQTDNVRSALALVAAGEAPLGVVYATDAHAEPRVAILGLFPESSHAPILYPAAALTDGDAGAAAAFLAYLRGPAGAQALAAQGFIPAGD